GELVEGRRPLRAPDQVAEERSVRPFAALVGRDPREVEERLCLGLLELERRRLDTGRSGESIAGLAQPRIHRPDATAGSARDDEVHARACGQARSGAWALPDDPPRARAGARLADPADA